MLRLRVVIAALSLLVLVLAAGLANFARVAQIAGGLAAEQVH